MEGKEFTVTESLTAVTESLSKPVIWGGGDHQPAIGEQDQPPNPASPCSSPSKTPSPLLRLQILFSCS